MKMTMVIKTKTKMLGSSSVSYKEVIPLGIFSDHQEAIEYCERVDPNDECTTADEFTVDELVPVGPVMSE